MPVDLRLAKKGRKEPLRGLVQQGRVSAELGTAKADPLSKNGWSPADTTSLTSNLDQLDTDAAAQSAAMASTVVLTKNEVAARAAAKKFARKVRNALPRVLRENPEIAVTLEMFESGALRDSTPRILAYLKKIRPHIVLLDEPLKPFFDGALASAELDTVSTTLEKADAVQEATIEQLPAESLKVYELMGRVLEQIEDLNRAGRSAFDGNATEIAAFNKDILVRARKAKKAEAKKNDDAGEPENDES